MSKRSKQKQPTSPIGYTTIEFFDHHVLPPSKMPPLKTEIDETLTGPSEPPAQHFQLGDLTPEYVRWFGENNSKEEFNRKYSNRRYRIPEDCHKYLIH